MQKDYLKDIASGLEDTLELGAYEYLWDKHVSSFKQLNELRTDNNASTLQELTGHEIAQNHYQKALELLSPNRRSSFDIIPRYSDRYPKQLEDAKYPFPLLYTAGNNKLLYRPGIAVVGSRKPSEEGRRRARKVAFLLAQKGYTIISGLAAGIDRAAHLAALEAGSSTVGVLGTPIDSYYPKENRELQDAIGSKHLLVSSVPIIRNKRSRPAYNRMFFPERNKLMSALSLGTIIVEAGETSGTLIQARAALEQGRKLFILQSCFENRAITWPAKYESMGAIRVREIYDIESALESVAN